MLVVNRHVVDAAVLPDDVVCAANRRAFRVVDRTRHVQAGTVAGRRHGVEQVALGIETIRQGCCAQYGDDKRAAQEKSIAAFAALGRLPQGGFPFLSLVPVLPFVIIHPRASDVREGAPDQNGL